MRHLKKFDTISEYTALQQSLSIPNLSYIVEDCSIRNIGDDDIIPIEYLQSSGTQYISTNIIPDANTGIMLTIMRLNNTDSYICGVRNDSGNTRWVLGCPNYSGYGTVITASSYPAINIKYDVGLNYLNNKKFTIPLNDVATDLPALSFTPTTDIRLFGSSGVNASYTKWTGKIYACKISQNNSIVCNLIPVRIGSVGYMFDKISKKLFANSGTGNFTFGADIVPVEYLQTDGNAYLECNIGAPVNGAKIRWNGEFGYNVSASTRRFLFSCSDQNKAFYCEIQTNNKFASGSGTAIDSVLSLGTLYEGYYLTTVGTRREIGLKVNGEYMTNSATNYVTESTSATFNLFRINQTYSGAGQMIGKNKIYYNDILVRDFIPVRIGTVGYMYDKVSGKLFANAGTGSFTIGPDDSHTKLTRNN